MTGLERLAGGRDAGATAPAGALAAAATDRAGDADRFGAILSGLARPEPHLATPVGVVALGVEGDRPSIPTSGATDLDLPAPGAAADRFGAILSELARPEPQLKISGAFAAPGGSGDRAANPTPAATDRDLSAPGGADLESSFAAFADRIAGTRGLSHDGDVVPVRAERETRPPEPGDGQPGSSGEAGPASDAAPGWLQASWGRAGDADAASSGSLASDSSAPVRSRIRAASGLGTGPDLPPPAAALAAASGVGPRSFAVATSGPPEAPVEADRSRGTGASAPESVRGATMPSDPRPRPQGLGQAGRSISEDGAAELGKGQLPAPPDVAQRRDSTAAIFAGGEEPPALSGPAREKVTVLAAATHFPPAGILSPVDQIFHRVAADLGSAVVPADPKRLPAPAGDRGEARDASATCIRILTVLLEPASLGPVTVTLRLSGMSLELEIEADDAATTRLIGSGRQALTGKLRALGLSVDTFVVLDVGRPRRTP